MADECRCRRKVGMAQRKGQLWSGERRPIVVLAVALRPPADGDLGTTPVMTDDGLLSLATASSLACDLIARAGGVVIERTWPTITAVWGYPSAAAGGMASAAAVADAIADAGRSEVASGRRSKVSVAIVHGQATILDVADGLLWSPAVAEARRLADAANEVGMPPEPVTDSRRDGDAVARVMAVQARLDALPRTALDLLRVLAIFGDKGDEHVIRSVLGVGRATLGAALGVLSDAGLVLAAPGLARNVACVPLHDVRLASPDLMKLVAQSVLEGDRRRIHARALAAVADVPSTRIGTRADDRNAVSATAPGLVRLAFHAEQAGHFDLALGTLETAISVALASDRASDAGPCIEAALGLIARPDVAISTRRQLDVIRMAATATGALHGNAHPNVRTLCQSGIDLLESSGDADCELEARFELLWGLQTHDLVRGEIGRALRTGQTVRALADISQRTDLMCVASRIYGLTAFKAGDLGTARAALARTIALVDTSDGHDGDGLARCASVPFASDQKAIALAALAWVEAVSGHTHRSADLARMALQRVAAMRHPHTEAHVTSLLSTRAYLTGEWPLALSLARTAQSLAREHGFDYWSTWAAMMAAASDQAVDPADAASRIATALSRYMATGARQAAPLAALLLARAFLAAGDGEAAAAALGDALPMVAPNRVTLWRSPLLTMQARVALHLGRVAIAGDGCWRDATSPQDLATAAYDEARRIGAGLFAGYAANALLGIVAGGDDGAYRRMTHMLVA